MRPTGEYLQSLTITLLFRAVCLRGSGKMMLFLSGCLYRYKAVGHVITTSEEKPSLDKIQCVQSDSLMSEQVCRTLARSMLYSVLMRGDLLPSNERYLPSSTNWFFSNGTALYTRGNDANPMAVEPDGTNLPLDGWDYGECCTADASQLEFHKDNKFAAYGVGIKNNAGKSGYMLDTGTSFSIVAGDYLGESGPRITYNTADGVTKVAKSPGRVKSAMGNFVKSMRNEPFGEEGPTGA
ncbi:hypothetical protein MLD38_038976 [Melastoma candidum]|uniref:Uncharacterized protein n=1 Tax=Melastoma candidum TaxID=119954 RepID=A0ACB9L1B2_9MYRT|nr:hypothetical protein MLD38_038976 [Melastoma candidum]